MGHPFWESTHSARASHHCDWCCNQILPGHIYDRQAWPVGPGKMMIMRQHSKPSCPPNEVEEYILKEMRAERAALGEPVYIVAKERLVQKMLVNGDSVTESETEFVTVVGEPYEPLHDSDHDKDIPF